MPLEKAKILFNTFPTSFWDAATKNTASILTAFVAILTLLASVALTLSIWGNLDNPMICVLCILLWVSFFVVGIITIYTALKSPKKMLQNSVSIMLENVLGDSSVGEVYSSSSEVEKSKAQLTLSDRKPGQE